MAIFSALVRVEPSYVSPDVIVQYNQASGAFDLLATGDPLVRLGAEDQYVYMRALSVRTQVQGGDSPGNNLPSCSVVAQEISTKTYLFRNRAEYDHHDTAMASKWGVALPQAQSLAMRAGHFQNARGGLLYGFNPQNGEGLVNANGATTVSLPPDPYGNTTVSTYDNGAMAFFLASQVEAAKAAMYQLGMPARVAIVGPQRVLGPMQYQNIVQLTSYQREGAGTASVKRTLEDIMTSNQDVLDWNYDDTLQGKGAGGNDLVILTIPEIKRPKRAKINTNVFAELTPSLDATTLQYCDMAAPREIPIPLPMGATDVTSEWRLSSGWGVRGEAIRILSMQYA